MTAARKDRIVVEKRFNVRFGDAPEAPPVTPVPRDAAELLKRAMALIAELRDADFVPEEFHDEIRALRTAWDRL